MNNIVWCWCCVQFYRTFYSIDTGVLNIFLIVKDLWHHIIYSLSSLIDLLKTVRVNLGCNFSHVGVACTRGKPGVARSNSMTDLNNFMEDVKSKYCFRSNWIFFSQLPNSDLRNHESKKKHEFRKVILLYSGNEYIFHHRVTCCPIWKRS